MAKKIAVVLSGCGKADGSEIHEAVVLLAAIAEAGAKYQCFAPDMEQHDVVDHYAGREVPERRSVLREAARIARGDIKPLSEFRVEDYDALAFPGGFGAAKNLSTYAFAGKNATINAEVKDAILGMHKAEKPIAALCIAPVLLAIALRKGAITLGQECDASKDAEAMGAKHHATQAGEFVVDRENRLYTAPCYMLESSITDLMREVFPMIKQMVGDMK